MDTIEAPEVEVRGRRGGLKCYVVPNRSKPRTFTAISAARVVCAAIENGASWDDIQDEVEKRCVDDSERQKRCDCNRIRNILTNLITAAIAIVAALALLRVIPVLIRTIPQFLLAGVPAMLRLAGPKVGQAALPRAIGTTIEGEFRVLSVSSEKIIVGLREAIEAAGKSVIP